MGAFVPGTCSFLRFLTRRRQDSKAEHRGCFSDQFILGDVQHPGQRKHPETHPEIWQASGNTFGNQASIRKYDKSGK